MNRKTVFGLIFIAAIVLVACGPKADPESDFEASPMEGGKGVAITKYIGSKFEVHIPAKIKNLPVVSIRGGFKEAKITSVTIPNSVTSIGDYAFAHCIGLASITIPDSVTSIGKNGFSDCTGLSSITIPGSVTSIGEWAFAGCTGLASITIPNIRKIARLS